MATKKPAYTSALFRRKLTACELQMRYPGHSISSELLHVDAEHVEGPPLPGVSAVELEVLDEKVLRKEKPSRGDVQACWVEVRVLLLKLPRAATRYPSQFTKIIAGESPQSTKSKPAYSFYGGYLEPDVDGEADSHAAHVACAVRHLHAQADLDLAALAPEHWQRFATFHYRRAPGREQGLAKETVYLVPKVWELDGQTNLAVRRVEYNDVKTVEEKVMRQVEVEEEEEVEVEQVVPGQEGVTEEELVKEMVKLKQTKLVKKTVVDVVKSKKVTVEPFATPITVGVGPRQSGKSYPSSSFGYVVALLWDWLLASAARTIADGLEAAEAKKVAELTRKRKRAAAEDDYQAQKRRKVGERANALEAQIAEMEKAWKGDDEGLTDEEIEAARAQRQEEVAKVKADAKAEWESQDAEDAAAHASATTAEVEAAEAEGTDLALLTAFSFLDTAAKSSTFHCFDETANVGALQDLLVAGVPGFTRKKATHLVINSHATSGGKCRYRAITDPHL